MRGSANLIFFSLYLWFSGQKVEDVFIDLSVLSILSLAALLIAARAWGGVGDLGIFIVGCLVTMIWIAAVAFLIWGETKN